MDIVKTTKELAEIVDSKNLTKISVKLKDVEICVESKVQQVQQVVSSPLPAGTPLIEGGNVPLSEGEGAKREGEKKSGNYVTSPIVGTFYSKPAPDKPPFVQIGDKVKKGQVVCIVESMKLMNEINCEFDGTVGGILALDGEAVDFGKELIEIV